MTARQRQAPGSSATPVNGDESHSGASAFRWEAWFAAASPDQRDEALALARRQGVLYLSQLPATSRSQPSASSLESLLALLLQGKADSLPPLADDAIECSDIELDPVQREAVRRALNTPDFFVLQGIPGTGKSRVITEVIVQAARRGWRVLFLAPTAPAIDVVLERLADRADVLPIRLLGPEENAGSLPAGLARLTLAEQRRTFRVQAQEGSRRARAQADETCQRRQREEAIWPQLTPLAERHAALAPRIAQMMRRLDAVPGEVEREAAGLPATGKGLPSGPFASLVIDLHRRHGKALAVWQEARKAIEEKQARLQTERDNLAAQLAAILPKCRAREQGRWWTLAYWTGGSALAQRDALQSQQARIDGALKALDPELAVLDEQHRQIETEHGSELTELLSGEVDRRRHELSAELAVLERDRDALHSAWQSFCQAIAPADLQPERADPTVLAAARQRWETQRRRDEEGCRFARQWADYLDEAGEPLAARLPALANLLAGPMSALTRSREAAEVTATPFDLLIVEETEMLTEADLRKLAGYAPRLMLVGDALAESTAPAGPRVGNAALTGCWPRLWQTVADDLGQLPYRWQREGDRLVCQLAAIRPEDARHVERENLTDAAEIELSILSLPRATPVLARVSFPASFTIPAATAFIYRELQELPVQPLGRSAWWEETPAASVLHLGPVATATESVALETGVQMALVADGVPYAGRAARITFTRDAGFDATSTRRWVESHLRVRDRHRAVFLQVPYRMHRGIL